MLRKMSNTNMQAVPRCIAWAVFVWASCVAICTSSPIDELPIPADARDTHRQSFSDSKSKELSYRLERPYPQDSPSPEQTKLLIVQGWTKCSGPSVGWDSYVDASRGLGHERTVFQNVTYWSKGDALLMIASFYYGGVTHDSRAVKVPGNSDEFVALSEDHNPAVKEKLKLTCGK